MVNYIITQAHESVRESRAVMSEFLRPHGLYSPWNSLGQNIGVSSLSLLQGIFPTQGSKPGLPHCRQILYWLSHQGSPRIVEWVAYPFSGGSSQPRNRTGVSCIAGGFFTSWPARKAQNCVYIFKYIYISPPSRAAPSPLSKSLVQTAQWHQLWFQVLVYKAGYSFSSHLSAFHFK